MSAIWSVADHFGVVPQPTNDVMARTLDEWWAKGRLFACEHAKADAWIVVLPDRKIVCRAHFKEAFEAEQRCAYCHEDAALDEADILLFELPGRAVTFAGRTHPRCADEAADRE